MKIKDAVKFVEKNVGECITIHKNNDNNYVAIAYRQNAPFSDKRYSTHRVNQHGCISGVYDMDFDTAWENFTQRVW